MKKLAIAAACLTLLGSASALASTDTHVHTPFCNHQWSDHQGALSFAAPPLNMSTGSVNTGTGMTFVLNDLGGVGPGTEARAAFEAAAALWSSVLLDPITIVLDVRFAALGQGILGSTGSTTNTVGYNNLTSLLVADATSSVDLSTVASLQTGPLAFVSNEPAVGAPISATVRTLDNNNTFDNNNVQLNTAQVKALGLVPTYAANNPGGRDGSVSFSTAFSWDFDRSDGLTPGSFDFVGVAAHEIGHALGFRSGVDLADGNIGASGLNNISWGTLNDLQRFGSFQGLQTLDWSIGGSPCLSIDAGASCVGLLSTGRNNGDGRQASHWKDDSLLPGISSPLGIMDPTVAAANGGPPVLVITELDLIAFDAMGYDVTPIPESSTWALMLAGAGVLSVAVRRRRRDLTA